MTVIKITHPNSSVEDNVVALGPAVPNKGAFSSKSLESAPLGLLKLASFCSLIC